MITCRSVPLPATTRRRLYCRSVTFLRINGVQLVVTQDEVVDLVIALADGSIDEVGAIAKRLEPWA